MASAEKNEDESDHYIKITDDLVLSHQKYLQNKRKKYIRNFINKFETYMLTWPCVSVVKSTGEFQHLFKLEDYNKWMPIFRDYVSNSSVYSWSGSPVFVNIFQHYIIHHTINSKTFMSFMLHYRVVHAFLQKALEVQQKLKGWIRNGNTPTGIHGFVMNLGNLLLHFRRENSLKNRLKEISIFDKLSKKYPYWAKWSEDLWSDHTNIVGKDFCERIQVASKEEECQVHNNLEIYSPDKSL